MPTQLEQALTTLRDSQRLSGGAVSVTSVNIPLFNQRVTRPINSLSREEIEFSLRQTANDFNALETVRPDFRTNNPQRDLRYRASLMAAADFVRHHDRSQPLPQGVMNLAAASIAFNNGRLDHQAAGVNPRPGMFYRGRTNEGQLLLWGSLEQPMRGLDQAITSLPSALIRNDLSASSPSAPAVQRSGAPITPPSLSTTPPATDTDTPATDTPAPPSRSLNRVGLWTGLGAAGLGIGGLLIAGTMGLGMIPMLLIGVLAAVVGGFGARSLSGGEAGIRSDQAQYIATGFQSSNAADVANAIATNAPNHPVNRAAIATLRGANGQARLDTLLATRLGGENGRTLGEVVADGSNAEMQLLAINYVANRLGNAERMRGGSALLQRQRSALDRAERSRSSASLGGEAGGDARAFADLVQPEGSLAYAEMESPEQFVPGAGGANPNNGRRM